MVGMQLYTGMCTQNGMEEGDGKSWQLFEMKKTRGRKPGALHSGVEKP